MASNNYRHWGGQEGHRNPRALQTALQITPFRVVFTGYDRCDSGDTYKDYVKEYARLGIPGTRHHCFGN